MARPLRIEYEGAWYHVMNRGRSREKIYFDKRDYREFLNLLGQCSNLFELAIHAYSLMPNHYHLLVRTPRGNLSRAMRHLDGIYTQRMNRKHKRDGSLFRGRYKSILVEKEKYIMALVRYIHRNPFEAKLEKDIGKHEWTSHRIYMSSKKDPVWLIRDEVLREFGRHERQAKREMHRFVEKNEKELEIPLDGKRWPAILGGDKFKEWVKETYLGKDIMEEKEVPQINDLIRDKSIGELLKIMSEQIGFDEQDIRRNKRGDRNSLRRAFVYISRMKFKKTSKEIGEFLGNIGYSAVSMQYRNAIEEIKKKRGCYKTVRSMEKVLI
jgi:putative transposase